MFMVGGSKMVIGKFLCIILVLVGALIFFNHLKYLDAVENAQMMYSLMQGANMDVFGVTDDYQGGFLLMFISCCSNHFQMK